MPKVIEAADVKITRVFGGTGAWDAAKAALRGYLEDEKQRTTKAIAFDKEDGFTDVKVNDTGQTQWMVGLQSLRIEAKRLGYKITAVWDKDHQWLGVKFNGTYIAMDAAKAAERAAKAAATRASKGQQGGKPASQPPQGSKGGNRR